MVFVALDGEKDWQSLTLHPMCFSCGFSSHVGHSLAWTEKILGKMHSRSIFGFLNHHSK
jgi:hypothetical protein